MLSGGPFPWLCRFGGKGHTTHKKDPLLPGDPVLPGNVLPSIAPQAQKLLQIMPAPNVAGAITSNYVAPIANDENYHVTTDGVDQNLGENARLFFRIAYFNDSPDYGGASPFDALFAPNAQWNWVAGYTQTISPTMVNALYVGRNSMWTNAVNNFYQNPSTQSYIKDLGIPGFPFDPNNPDAPVIAVNGYLGVGNGGTNWFQTDEYAHYNALNVIFNQRMFHGASLRLAYTWSHNLDIGTDSNGGGYLMDAYNMNRDYASSDWDVRNRFVASYVHQMPFFQNNSSRLVRGALGNWQLNGITTLQSGFPINAGIGQDIVNTGVAHQRPNLITSPSSNCGSGHLTNCIDKSVYALPAQHTYGTAGRNMLNGAGLITFDTSLFKDIRLTERWGFQFRAELFNLFNTPAISNPSATFGASSFGTVGSTKGNNRETQFAGKLVF